MTTQAYLTKRPIHSHLVLISAPSNTNWHEGYGRLFEPFEFDEPGGDFAILHVSECPDAPTARPGYYIIESVITSEAARNGLMLTDTSGDGTGYKMPASEPADSLEKAIEQLLTFV